MSEALITQMRAARRLAVDLAPGKRVYLLRPLETQFSAYMRTAGEGGKVHISCTVAQVQALAVDWQGITEADLLGAAVGASDPAPFSVALWAEAVADRMDWAQACSQAVVQGISAFIDRTEADRKNSTPA